MDIENESKDEFVQINGDEPELNENNEEKENLIDIIGNGQLTKKVFLYFMPNNSDIFCVAI